MNETRIDSQSPGSDPYATGLEADRWCEFVDHFGKLFKLVAGICITGKPFGIAT